MERFAINKLIDWKKSKNRKPLIIEGARQVGKTYLMREFGSKFYKNTLYVNFDRNERAKDRFKGDIDPARILKELSVQFECEINENTLIIFDEIQECKNALRSLKYFCEETPQYSIMAAGSLLGVALHENDSFPVGKTDFLQMYPLSFYEFLLATGKKMLVDILREKDVQTITSFKDTLTELLRVYYITGGMPAVVNSYISDSDFAKVRETQNAILTAYQLDFSKHIPLSAYPKVGQIWNSLPQQLTKENKKFAYNLVAKNAKSKEYSVALNWLVKTGLSYEINKVSKPDLPLSAYAESGFFKLYSLDVGLLGALSGLDTQTVLNSNTLFTEFKGALTEQFVLQQLKALGIKNVYYWTSNANAEIDFLIQRQNDVIPVEVKASINNQAKSLKVYRQKYSPRKSYRISLNGYKVDDDIVNIPLYAMESFV